MSTHASSPTASSSNSGSSSATTTATTPVAHARAPRTNTFPSPSPSLNEKEIWASDIDENARVLLIATGGTLASSGHKDGGLSPVLNALTDSLKKFPQFFSHEYMPQFDVLEWEDPIDSSMFNPDHWVKLASEIEQNYYDYSGFVIIHGTDTLAYTAAALSFMLDGLSKPVVLTGAQIPIGELVNDAHRNLILSILVAAHLDIPEVTICFTSSLLRGNRSSKADTWSLDPYMSPNYPPLAKFGVSVSVAKPSYILSPPHRKFRVHKSMFRNIAVLWLIPGFNPDIIDSYADNASEKNVKGLILVAFGAGNAPIVAPDFRAAIERAIKRNVVVVICSQCRQGSIDLQVYRLGQELSRMGCVSAGDMTIEATVAKLSYLLGRGFRGAHLKQALEFNLRGELTKDLGFSKAGFGYGPMTQRFPFQYSKL